MTIVSPKICLWTSIRYIMVWVHNTVKLLPGTTYRNTWRRWALESWETLSASWNMLRRFTCRYMFCVLLPRYWFSSSVVSQLAECYHLKYLASKISQILLSFLLALFSVLVNVFFFLQESRKRERSANINASLMKSTSTKLSSVPRSTSPAQMAAVSTTSNTTKKVKTSGKCISLS